MAASKGKSNLEQGGDYVVTMQGDDLDDGYDGDKYAPQMEMFQITEPSHAKERFSNTMDIYDALPKYSWSGPREITDMQAPDINKVCSLKGTKYRVSVKPARLKRGNGYVLIFPGEREEFVEEALRKIAASGFAVTVNDQLGVGFSVYQLKQELASVGHTYSSAEIKEAIEVCHNAKIEVGMLDRDSSETLVSSSFFPTMALTNRKQYLDNPGDSKCFVVFNPLVSRSFFEASYRRINYTTSMSISSPLAREIHKRLTSVYFQASNFTPYTRTLKSFLEESARGLHENMSQNVRALKRALDLLVKMDVLARYESKVLKKGRFIENITYVLWPSEKFIKEMIISNKEAAARLAKMEITQMKRITRR